MFLYRLRLFIKFGRMYHFPLFLMEFYVRIVEFEWIKAFFKQSTFEILNSACKNSTKYKKALIRLI